MDKKAFMDVVNSKLMDLTETGSAVTRDTEKAGSITVDFDKAVNGALKTFASGARKEDVLLLIDDTVLSSGKKGVVMTTDAIYFSASFDTPFSAKYADIGRVEVGKDGHYKKLEDSADYSVSQLHVFDKADNEVFVYDTSAVSQVPLKDVVDAALAHLV